MNFQGLLHLLRRCPLCVSIFNDVLLLPYRSCKLICWSEQTSCNSAAALPPESSVDETATPPAVEAPPVMQGQRPVVVPSSVWRGARAPSVLLLVVASILVLIT
uniref:Uncharacterized protein n=1 Tax=Aegilops tauschii subsp. strangulata TaxID=200361 RepID=A0A453M1J3_AEGTS